MSLTFFVFLAGLIYGFVSPGREDRLRLLRNSIIVGFVLGLLISIAFLMFTLPFGIFVPFLPIFGTFTGAALGVFVALYFGVVFIAGTFVGDLLESLLKR
ncbi:hypothetical protein [Geoglobus sp.]